MQAFKSLSKPLQALKTGGRYILKTVPQDIIGGNIISPCKLKRKCRLAL